MRTVAYLAWLALIPASTVADRADPMKQGLSWEEAVIADTLAGGFDMTDSEVLRVKRRLGVPQADLAPLLFLRKESRRDVDTIWRMRAQGHGWGVIAHRLGVHPGTFNKRRVALKKMRDSEFEDIVWRDKIRPRLGVPGPDIDWARKQGMSWRDVCLSAKVAKESRKDMKSVAKTWRKNNKRWDKVRTEFGVATNKKVSGKKNPKNADKDKGRGHGKANKDGKRKGKGNG